MADLSKIVKGGRNKKTKEQSLKKKSKENRWWFKSLQKKVNFGPPTFPVIHFLSL
jgi:hypothetical protein